MAIIEIVPQRSTTHLSSLSDRWYIQDIYIYIYIQNVINGSSLKNIYLSLKAFFSNCYELFPTHNDVGKKTASYILLFSDFPLNLTS